MSAPPPPSYNTATNYGYHPSPHQHGGAGGYAMAQPPQPATRVMDKGPTYSLVPDGPAHSQGPAHLAGGANTNGYPPQNPAYPPQNPAYPPQNPAYPPPNPAYPPPPQSGQPGGYYPAPQAQGGAMPMNSGGSSANEDGRPKPAEVWDDNAGWAGNSFSEKAIRLAFIRKVYLILMVQLFFTFGVILFCVLHIPTRLWIQAHQWIYWPSYAVFLITYIVLVCCPGVRRKWPMNFICLIIFTIAMTYMSATISSFYNIESVAIAMGITAGVSLAISLFACQTKWDFTKCGGVLFAASIALMLFGLVCIIWYTVAGPNRILHAVYGGLAAVLFSAFLAYDTQMLMGGKKYELSPEDHIFGALQLYLDIVYLFLIFLSLFGSSD